MGLTNKQVPVYVKNKTKHYITLEMNTIIRKSRYFALRQYAKSDTNFTPIFERSHLTPAKTKLTNLRPNNSK